MRRIGLLGGTFDPIHRGHVELARLARERLRLERVLLAPAGVQPVKSGEGSGVESGGASWEERLAMVELAVEGVEGLEASAVDAPRGDGRPNFSSETVARLAEELAGDGGEPAEIIFLMGADTFAGFRRWHDPLGLLQRADLGVASRPGYVLAREGAEVAKFLPDGAKFLGKEEMGEGEEQNAAALVYLCGSALVRVYVLRELAEDIAATELRAELARGRGWEWLDARVAAYVRERGLYGSGR